MRVYVNEGEIDFVPYITPFNSNSSIRILFLVHKILEYSHIFNEYVCANRV